LRDCNVDQNEHYNVSWRVAAAREDARGRRANAGRSGRRGTAGHTPDTLSVRGGVARQVRHAGSAARPPRVSSCSRLPSARRSRDGPARHFTRNCTRMPVARSGASRPTRRRSWQPKRTCGSSARRPKTRPASRHGSCRAAIEACPLRLEQTQGALCCCRPTLALILRRRRNLKQLRSGVSGDWSRRPSSFLHGDEPRSLRRARSVSSRQQLVHDKAGQKRVVLLRRGLGRGRRTRGGSWR
jgi:hypothetical protein